MKVSEVTISEIKKHTLISHSEDDGLLEIIKKAALAYIQSYTGLSKEQIDSKEDLTIAFLVLCTDMYENRLTSVQNDKVNKVISNILNMHSINYV